MVRKVTAISRHGFQHYLRIFLILLVHRQKLKQLPPFFFIDRDLWLILKKMLHLIIFHRMLTLLLNLTLRPILKILLHQTTRPIVRLPDIPRQVFLELIEYNPYQFHHLKRIFLCIEME
jgi:hypothetical protein